MELLFSSIYQTYINHTDAGGIVYHGHFLTFYENCRRDWFTKLGYNGYFFADEIKNGKKVTYHPVVSQANTKFIKPILIDSKIKVTIDEVKIKPASLVFIQSIYNQQDNTLISQAHITIACVKNEVNEQTAEKQLSPARVPESLKIKINNWLQTLSKTI